MSANSPAQKSGIERGDIITEVNGKPVTDANTLRMTISMMPPDASANLKVLRNGSERELTAKLGDFPAEQSADSNGRRNDRKVRIKAPASQPGDARRLCRRTSMPTQPMTWALLQARKAWWSPRWIPQAKQPKLGFAAATSSRKSTANP